MADFSFINTGYSLNKPVNSSCTGFYYIWRVDGDSRYRKNRGPRKNFSFHSLFLTMEGEGRINLINRNRTIRLPGPSAVYIPPCEDIDYRTGEGNLWKFYYIAFNKDTLIKEMDFPENSPIEKVSAATIKRICHEIISTLIKKERGCSREADMLLQQLICALGKEMNTSLSSRDKEITAAVKWIHENRNRPIESEDLLHLTGLKKTAFYRLFRNYTGKTPGRYIRDLKMEDAANLLVQTNMKVYETALATGYHDEFHFSRQFKDHYGVSPSDFRLRTLQKELSLPAPAYF